MGAFTVFRDRGKRTVVFFLIGGFLCAAQPAAGDMMSSICNNQVVSVGARKGEVLAKCGNPLSKSQDRVSTETSQIIRQKKADKKKTDKDKAATTEKAKTGKPAKDKTVATRKTTKEREETWTYNIDGSYRVFIFKEGKLDRIEAGGLVN